MRQVLLAFQFLTIVPVKVHGEITEKEIAGSAAFFPLVGAFQGLVAAVPAFLLMKVMPADIASGISLLLLISSNGGFDLDGLADTFDALAVKSTGDAEADRARRLAVMKDSTAGAIGVVALVMAILLKFILMKRLLSDVPVSAACTALFLMPVFSKWITVPAMYHSVSARSDGLGKTFIEHASMGSVILSTIIVALLSLSVASLNLTGTTAAGSIAMSVFFGLACYLFGLLAIKFLMRRFGGLTGDHFGALTEISEIFLLMGAYVWLRRSIS